MQTLSKASRNWPTDYQAVLLGFLLEQCAGSFACKADTSFRHQTLSRMLLKYWRLFSARPSSHTFYPTLQDATEPWHRAATVDFELILCFHVNRVISSGTRCYVGRCRGTAACQTPHRQCSTTIRSLSQLFTAQRSDSRTCKICESRPRSYNTFRAYEASSLTGCLRCLAIVHGTRATVGKYDLFSSTKWEDELKITDGYSYEQIFLNGMEISGWKRFDVEFYVNDVRRLNHIKSFGASAARLYNRVPKITTAMRVTAAPSRNA